MMSRGHGQDMTQLYQRRSCNLYNLCLNCDKIVRGQASLHQLTALVFHTALQSYTKPPLTIEALSHHLCGVYRYEEPTNRVTEKY